MGMNDMKRDLIRIQELGGDGFQRDWIISGID